MRALHCKFMVEQPNHSLERTGDAAAKAIENADLGSSKSL